MSRDTRNGVILAVLLVVMAALWYRVWRQAQVSGVPAATADAGDQRAASAAAQLPPSVDLATLRAERPAVSDTRRNLFQYGGREPAAVSAPVFAAPPPVQVAPTPAAPAEPSVTLTLIGIVRPLDDSPLVAVLSDERGVYYGSEGTIIEGRYRVVRVDTQAVELSTVDGNGLFVLRLPPS